MRLPTDTGVLQRQAKTIVGLDIETGSIAATEVGATAGGAGSSAPRSPARSRGLPRGRGHRPRGARARAQGPVCREQALEGRAARIANQRIAVRTLRLPLIENAGELETAIRFQAQDQIPMPLEQAVLDWQVVGHGTAEGEPGRGGVSPRAATCSNRLLEAVRRRAAAGRDRPVRVRDDPRPRTGGRARPGARPRRSDLRTRALGQRRGRGAPCTDDAATSVRPAKLYCNLGDVTNLAVARGARLPVHPDLAVRDRGHRPEARRAAPAQPRATPASGSLTSGWRLRSRRSRATRRPWPLREALVEGAGKLVDELRLSLEFYGAQEGAVADRGSRRLRPRDDDPGARRAAPARPRPPFEIGRPSALARSTEAAAAADALLRPRPGGVGCVRST